jgi:hypothetical protein
MYCEPRQWSDKPAKRDPPRTPRLAGVGGLAAVLGLRPVVLMSAAVLQRVAPFSPSRIGWPTDCPWVGLKKAGVSANRGAGDVRGVSTPIALR